MNWHDGTFITGALLLVLSGLAMRPVLKPYAPVRSLGDLVLRVICPELSGQLIYG